MEVETKLKQMPSKKLQDVTVDTISVISLMEYLFDTHGISVPASDVAQSWHHTRKRCYV